MAHAGAERMRTRAPRQIGEARANIAGYARMLSHPAYERLRRSERFLRRLIPILIVIFLAIVAAARWVSLSSTAAQLRASAETELEFIAELLADRIQALNVEAGSSANRNLVQNLIADSVPARYLRDGREILVSDAQGRILANLPFYQARQDLPLEHVIGDALLLTTFGKRAEIRSVELRNGQTAIAAHRILDGPISGVTIFQPEGQIFAQWRNDVSLNVTLFVGTSSILLVVLYAYFAQNTRAQRGRRNLQHRAEPLRYGAGARARRIVGLGFGARPDLLVALDVPDARLRAARRHARLSPRSRRWSIPTTSTFMTWPTRRSSRNRRSRPDVPHAPRRRALGVDADARRTGATMSAARHAPDRHRRRHHRGAGAEAAEPAQRHAAARRHREPVGSIRAVGRGRKATGDVQFEVPGICTG